MWPVREDVKNHIYSEIRICLKMYKMLPQREIKESVLCCHGGWVKKRNELEFHLERFTLDMRENFLGVKKFWLYRLFLKDLVMKSQ